MPTAVPYTGVPTAAPRFEPASPVHIDTPVAAFGGDVAQAIQHFGEVTKDSGQELFQRAYAMQELNEHAKANQQIAAYQDDLVKLRSDFAQYQGQDAATHLPDFIQQTEDLRQKYSGNLTSPYAKQLFDDESRSSRFRVIFSAGANTDEQLKRFDIESTQLGIAGAGHALANTDPYNDSAVSATLQKATDGAQHLALVTLGLHPGDTGYDEFVRQHTSMALRPSLDTMLKDPILGNQVLEKWHKDGKVSDDDYRVYKPRYNDAIRERGVVDTAAKLDSGGFNPGGQGPLPSTSVMSILPKVSGTGGYETVGREDPNGNGHALGQYGLSSADLAMRLREAGMKPMTEEEFLKDHGAQDQLANSFFSDAQKKYGSFNEALTAWTGGIDTDKRVAAAQKEIVQNTSHAKRAEMVDKTAKDLGLDPVATDRLHKQVSNIQDQREADIARDNYTYSNTVTDALMGVGAANGKVPTSRQELSNLPGVSDAMMKLNQTPEGKRYLATLDKSIEENIKRGGYTHTEENVNMFNQLKGIYYDPQATPADRKKLLDTVPSTLPMPSDMVNELQGLRKKLYDGVTADPNMTTAMQVMQPILQSMGYTKAQNPTKYYQFVGAFQAALKGETAGELRAIKDGDTIRKIGQMILQPNPAATPGWLGFGSQPLTFESPGDTPHRAEAEQNVRAQLKKLGIQRDPTTQEIDRATLLMQFEESGRSGKLSNRAPQGQ